MRSITTLALIIGAAPFAVAQTFLGSLGDKTYYITDQAGSFADARGVAASMGAGYVLTSIHSQAEQEFLNTAIQPFSKVWIGLSDEVLEGTFRWDDGTDVSFTNWGLGQPNNGSDRNWVYLDGTDSGDWKVTLVDGAQIIIPLRGVIATVVPEPATMSALGLGLLALCARRRRTG